MNQYISSVQFAGRETELAHYGIKGQKHGVRRFQNEDGSLTPAGKIRYRSESGKTGHAKGRTSGIENEISKWKSSDAKNLSDDELNRRNNRLQRERQYKDLITPQWKKDTKQIATDAFKKIFIGTATVLAAVAMKKNYEKIQSWLGSKLSQKMSEFKQSDSTRKAINRAVSRYSFGGRNARSMESPKMSAYRKYSSRG